VGICEEKGHKRNFRECTFKKMKRGGGGSTDESNEANCAASRRKIALVSCCGLVSCLLTEERFYSEQKAEESKERGATCMCHVTYYVFWCLSQGWLFAYYIQRSFPSDCTPVINLF
jgi:hypothetical protein